MDNITKGGPSAGGTTNMMHIFQSCNDISDAVELFGPQQLYLKPVARLNVSVQLPQLKQPGKTISNWEVMERLKNMVKPTEFIVLKVSKSTLEFIRFEGEIESKSNLEGVVSRLDGRTIKLSGFSDLLKVRAAEAKISFPTRHSWDSYFRDAKNMNEMKPGERPDTIHITNLPCKWFSSKHDLAHGSDLPSEYIFRKVFEQFGEVRCVDIPLLDPYRNLMQAQISGMKTFSFGQGLAFEGYVQFQEYVCFVKTMDALRGMKLLHKEGDKAYTASIKVDFDKTKHLSETSIRRRRQEREHLMANEREVEERERRAKEAQEREAEALRSKEREKQQMKEERRRQREERRKAKHVKRIKEEEARVMNRKIAIEERKLIIAQRKLESIRLLDELFERVKMKIQKEKSSPPKSQDAPIEDSKLTQGQKETSKEDLSLKERELRQRLLRKYKSVQEKLLEEQREKLRRTVEGKTRLQSVATKPTDKDESSDSSSERRSPSHRSDKNKKRNGDRRSDSAERRYDWYPGMPMSNLPSMDLTAYVQAYGFQQRFPYREGFYRQRGRWQRYSRGRNVQPLYYGQWNEEYYKYFRKVAKRSRSRSISRSRTRSRSRSGRRSNSRSRRRSRSRSRSNARRRSKSKSRQRSRSKTKSRSRSRSKSRSKSKSKRRSRSKSRSKSPRSRSKFDRSRSSPERSPPKTRNRSNSRSGHRSRSQSRSGSQGRRRRSSSRTRSSEKRRRSKSDSRSRIHKSNSSRGLRTSKSNRSRSLSPPKRSSKRSTSPTKRSSRSKSKNRSRERRNTKKSLRSLSRELSLSLSPEVDKRTLKEKSGKRSSPKDRDKKKSKKNKDSKNKEKQKSK